MTNTTHYNMTIAEGTDIVNPLTQIFPNFNTIDSAMYANKQSGIGTASEVTTGPVHAIVRANPDINVFRYTATSAWTAGDTMTLDGNAVVVHMSDGTVPATGAYIIGAEVLAMVNSGLVTLAISSNGGVTSFNSRTGNVVPENSDYTASMVDFDNTNTTLTSTEVQGAIEEVSSVKSDITSINETGSTSSQAIPSGTYFYLNGTLVRAKTDIASGATFTLNTNYEVVTIGDALEALNKGSVSVTADGVKSVRTLFNELYTLIDSSKLNQASWIDYGSSFYRLAVKTPSSLFFTRSFGVLSEMYHDTIVCQSSSSDEISWTIRAGGNTVTQNANTIPTAGTVITLYY